MKTAVFGLILVAGLSASASADIVLHGAGTPVTASVQAIAVPDSVQGGGLRVVGTNYDNWTNPGSNLLGLYNSAGNEIADDLHMVGVGAGLLNDMGLNVANVNGTSNLTGGTMVVRFYQFSTGNFISGFNTNLPALALAAGGSSRLSFGANALTALNIFLPADVYCSLQLTNITWSGAGTIANAGIQVRGPIITGTSADGMIDVTNAGATIAFGGNPAANTGIFIKTDTVPAPGAFALLGLGGLVAARRRR
jgi:MYXO-CTERM domain-containing protein